MNTQTPRAEYPRPQFVRDSWLNLNGEWTYTFDFGKSGMDAGRELFNSEKFDDKIIVPFCPESKLSGVEHIDFIEAMWYQRNIEIPIDWAGQRVLLNFGAVDYEAEIFIDGKSIAIHFGGSSSFSVDITRAVESGKTHNLIVRIKDELRPSGSQAGGKQMGFGYKSSGCDYTRTTGIWQTVWLEAVNLCGVKDAHIVPDLDGGRFIITPRYFEDKQNLKLEIAVHASGEIVAEAVVPATSGNSAELKLNEVLPWSPESPFLYDIYFTLKNADGVVLDEVSGYAGLRKVHIEGNKFYLNNEPLYQRLVLDQGFYPDGIWTAPSDGALKRDIELSMEAGFNGARLHQKVFEERFHYWADKLGYLTWGEYCSWGCDPNDPAAAGKMLAEWRSIVIRDRNHPSIIAWTPLNETRFVTNPPEHRRSHIEAYDVCKCLDATRPVNDASGYVHQITDIWTVHNYTQDKAKLIEELSIDEEKGVYRNYPEHEIEYTGQPYLVDEFGGIKWVVDAPNADNSWGYGEDPKTLDEVYERLEGQIDALISLEHIQGYCYTQLTDVEQEQNGIYNYDRTTKFDMAKIRACFEKTQ